MSATPVGGPQEGDPDAFAVAQHLLRLASSPWAPPTQESLEMAIAIYQAALKLNSGPPVYKADNPGDVESLQQRLATVTEELRLTKQELRDAREETARAFLAMNERLSNLRILNSPMGQSSQSYESSTAAESLREEVQNVQDSSVAEATADGDPSTEGGATATVPSIESTRGITITSETETQVSPSGDITPETQELERVEGAATARVPENRWAPSSVGRNRQVQDEHTLELVEKKVKALLNKLTGENCQSVSAQIAGWVNQAESEKNGQTLALVFKLIFEKATDEPQWSEMYAKLCKNLMDMISPGVCDGTSRNSAGELAKGGTLFRKYLLNRCQENFQRGWAPGDGSLGGGSNGGMPEMGSDEYYSIVKAKRQGLGLIQFIGELFKLEMVTERIIHECIKKLLPDPNDPNEAELESLLKLLTTVGELLDSDASVPKFKGSMDRYFGMIRMVANNDSAGSRIRYMILDVIELRQRRWQPRNAEAGSSMSTQGREQYSRSNMITVPGRRWSAQHGFNRGGSPLD